MTGDRRNKSVMRKPSLLIASFTALRCLLAVNLLSTQSRAMWREIRKAAVDPKKAPTNAYSAPQNKPNNIPAVKVKTEPGANSGTDIM